jgi:hypothetical protein
LLVSSDAAPANGKIDDAGRRGKNRCEMDPDGGACKRCLAGGVTCIFEKPTERRERARNESVTTEAHSNEPDGYVPSAVNPLISVRC